MAIPPVVGAILLNLPFLAQNAVSVSAETVKTTLLIVWGRPRVACQRCAGVEWLNGREEEAIENCQNAETHNHCSRLFTPAY
jgi:hypothetical protein